MKSKIILCLALVLSGGLFGDNCDAAIIYPKAPEGGRQIVYKNLNLYLNPDIPGVSRIEDLTIADPHREYFVGATNLASGHLLDTAESHSWRYPVAYGTNVVGVTTVFDADPKTGDPLRFGGENELFSPMLSKKHCESQKNYHKQKNRIMNCGI